MRSTNALPRPRLPPPSSSTASQSPAAQTAHAHPAPDRSEWELLHQRIPPAPSARPESSDPYPLWAAPSAQARDCPVVRRYSAAEMESPADLWAWDRCEGTE